MNTVFSYIDTQFISPSLPYSKKFRITNRELDILEFVLEMKFSTLEDIHSKFFKVTRDGGVSHSLIWARQRILNLVKSEFLQILTNVSAIPLYILTKKGFLYLKNTRTFNDYCRPLFDIDTRFLNHDQRVSQIRIELERRGDVKRWISERLISEHEEFKQTLTNEFRPDGIYETRDGNRVAFELEIARKSKIRYKQKVNRYINLILENDNQILFRQVHFVCEKESVLNLIKGYTELFQPYFKFNLVSDFLG